MSNAQVMVPSKLDPIKCQCDLDEECEICMEVSVEDHKSVINKQEESISQTVTFSNPDNSMDRFIPCRMKENLQAKFEAAS